MIYRRNEQGAWSAKISPQLQHTPPPTSWLLTSLPLPQSLYGQRSVVRWRHDQIFLGMGLRSRAKQQFRRNFLDNDTEREECECDSNYDTLLIFTVKDDGISSQ